jgi:hypothetical protein
MTSPYRVAATSLNRQGTGLLAAAPHDPTWAKDLRALRADLPAEGSPWDA